MKNQAAFDRLKGQSEKCPRRTREEGTSVTEVQRPDGVSLMKDVMEAPNHAITETRKPDGAAAILCAASGIGGKRLAERMLAQMELMQILWWKDTEARERALGALDMMFELRPANALEAMLTVQMVGVHEAALMFLKRATLEGRTFDGCDGNARWATRLLRLFNEQLEAMAKLKGKAGQKVTVEHVHVYQGGQAIVGAVTAGKKGRGEGEK